jgi:hypothetical protein
MMAWMMFAQGVSFSESITRIATTHSDRQFEERYRKSRADWIEFLNRWKSTAKDEEAKWRDTKKPKLLSWRKMFKTTTTTGAGIDDSKMKSKKKPGDMTGKDATKNASVITTTTTTNTAKRKNENTTTTAINNKKQKN